MRAAALTLVFALLAASSAYTQLRRPPDQFRRVESPAAAPYREGVRLLADEHWAEAADLFERAIDLDPKYALAFYGLGRARIGQKQYVAAVSALDRCAMLYLEQAGNNASQRMNLAQIRRDQILELREQLRLIQQLPQTPPRQQAADQIAEMIRDLERDQHEGMDGLVVRVPAFISLSLGSAHFRRGSMADAEREYRNAIKANPRMGEAHNNLAVVLLLTGWPAEAEKSVKDAEKAGFRVPSAVKEDIRRAKASQSS